MFDQISPEVVAEFINIVTAVVILIVGWIVALLVGSVVRGAIQKTGLSGQLAKLSEDEEGVKIIDLERWISKFSFYVVFLFVLIAFFQYLDLAVVAEPFSAFLTQIFNYLPMLFGALVLLLIAWIVATILRVVLLRLLIAIKIDERAGEQVDVEEEKRVSLSQYISKAAYWLVLLLFLPAILTALQLEGLLQPVQGMIAVVLTYLPQIAAAGLILFAGWFIGRILQKVTVNLLSSLGLDNLSERIGLAKVMGEQRLSKLFGLVVYALVLIVAIIAGLNALTLEAVTQPASNMLNMILAALPAILAASLVLIIAYAVGKIVKGLLVNLLDAAGFNNILAAVGISKEPIEGRWTPSEAAGYIAFVVIMLFAAIEAAGLLGFGLLANLVSQLLVFISHILLGLVILGIALYLGNLAHNAIKVTNTVQADLLAKVAKYSIVILGGAMALQRMGLADEIIIIAFGILLGACAVTVILAFGLGGKDVAAKELEDWINRYKSK